MNKQLVLVLLWLLICITPGLLRSQSRAIRWSSFGGGYGVSSSTTSQVRSLAGVAYMGNVSGTSNAVKSGFLPGLPQFELVSVHDVSGLPVEFALHQNFPNPFNPVSTIRYDLPHGSKVSLIVYDILGREVARLVTPEYTKSIKMLLLK